MKKWLVLSLTIVSGLSAVEANDEIAGMMRSKKKQESNRQEPNNECCKPCEPCCVPKPKPCINCECYVPPFYDLQCDLGFFTYGDFLYWYANEGNLSYAMIVEGDVNITAPSTLLKPKTTLHLGTNWDPGFRVGLGWNSGYDGWDLDANWTWYNNKKSNSVSVDPFDFDDTLPPGQLAIIDPWNTGGFGGIDLSASLAPVPNLFSSVAASWNFLLNEVELDLGRKFWLSRRFAMRPYAGGRGAWATTLFKNQAIGTIQGGHFNMSDRFKDKFWGAGLVCGFQPEWFMSPCFTVFANVDTSLLWGQFKINKLENYSLIEGAESAFLSNQFATRFNKMQAMLDLSLGFRWTKVWCQDRFRSSLDAGWEHHIWFDTNNRLKTNGLFSLTSTEQKGFTGYDELVGNLMFGGLVVSARFDY